MYIFVYIYCSYKRNELYESEMLFLYLTSFTFSIYPKRYFTQLYFTVEILLKAKRLTAM